MESDVARRMSDVDCPCAALSAHTSSTDIRCPMPEVRRLRLLGIDALEVFQYRAAFVCAEPPQIVPGGLAEARRRPAARGALSRVEVLVALRGLRLALLVVLALFLLQRSARIQQTTEELRLTRDGAGVD